MNIGEMLNPLEIMALLEKDAKITNVGIDGVVLEVEDFGEVLVWACMNCTGDNAHLNYAFIGTDSDAGAA